MRDERFGVLISFGAFFLILLGIAGACSASSDEKPTPSHSTTPEGKVSLEIVTTVFGGYMHRLENNEVICYGNHASFQCRWKDQG